MTIATHIIRKEDGWNTGVNAEHLPTVRLFDWQKTDPRLEF